MRTFVTPSSRGVPSLTFRIGPMPIFDADGRPTFQAPYLWEVDTDDGPYQARLEIENSNPLVGDYSYDLRLTQGDTTWWFATQWVGSNPATSDTHLSASARVNGKMKAVWPMQDPSVRGQGYEDLVFSVFSTLIGNTGIDRK